MTQLYLRTAIWIAAACSLFIAAWGPPERGVLYQNQVAVLMYHHVHDRDTSSSTVTPELFREQLEYLRHQGYQFITLAEFDNFMEGGTVPDNAVLVTFDDGYQSFHQFAAPVLRQLHVPAVNFIITDTLDDPRNANIPFLSREEIDGIAQRNGGIEFGCHTHGLHRKTDDDEAYLTSRLKTNGIPESDVQYEERITEDIRMCVQRASDAQSKPVHHLAYPFGIYNREAAQLAQRAGIRYAFTIVPEMATRESNRMAIPRINAGNPDITPDRLHRTIVRKIENVRHPFREVPLTAAVEQLGGLVAAQHNELLIDYGGKRWTARANGDSVAGPNGTLKLKQPIRRQNNTYYIRFDDLQTVLGIQIAYHASEQTFIPRVSPDEQIETNQNR